MSKEMKDFLSQFMNPPTPKIADEVEEKAKQPKTEKIIKPKSEKKATAPVKEKKILPDTEGVGEILSAEDFLKSINDKKYTFDKKKNLQIDDQLFTVLNLLKQYEGIKSIATLLNAIIEKYIEDNKTDLKRILSKNPLS